MENNWIEKENKLEKEFSFESFAEAIHFVNQIALLAEKAKHHPDILIHQYKKVLIAISTHEEDRITEKDKHLAAEIDKVF